VSNTTIDRAAPNTSITASPNDPSNSADASFSFTSSEGGSTFECKLDGSSFTPCTSSKDYTGLAAGSHTFEVRATDAGGNTDDSPASHTWTIDLTAADTSITAAPNDPSNDPDPSFSFTSSEGGSTFECKLDAGAFAPCTSPKDSTGLAAGSHTFEVRATDAAGNTDATPAMHSWTIDLGAPETTIDSAPADPTSSSDASFDFSSSESGSTFECKLDAGAFAPCTTPESYTGLAAGSHTFEVRATDAGGNTDATPAAHTWTIDLSAPDTTITSSPSDPSNDVNPGFSFTSSEPGSSFECKLDGGSFSPCVSPESYTGLTAGSHTFEVRATDAAGNTDATPASHSWTIDVTAPTASIDAAPGDPSGDPTPTFEFSANEAGSTFECQLDGGAYGSCSTPQTYGPLNDGNHSFAVRATDPAGNTGAAVTYDWLLDSGAPTVTLTAPSGVVNAGDADPYTVTATTPDTDVTNIAFFRCDNGSNDCATGNWVLLGNDPAAPYSASWPVDADGNRALRAVAIDAGTNTGVHVVNVTIDRTLPVTTIDSGPADPSSSPNASFSFSASEGGTTFSCSLDGGSFAPCSSPRGYTGLADGAHTFSVRATDAAGNVEALPPSYGWTIDTVDPNTAITIMPADPSNSSSATFEFAASEGGSSFRCELDGGGFSPCATPLNYSGLADGSHTFRVRAVDGAGNIDPTPASYTWLVDATAPGGGLTDPGSPLRGTVSLSASPSDGGAGVRDVEFQYSPADAGTWTTIAIDNSAPYTASWDTTAVGDGLYDLRIVVTDNALNTTASAPIEDRLVDNTAPSATMNDPGATLRGTVSLTSSVDDGPSGSGVATVTYQRSPADAGTWTTVAQSWDTTASPDGLYDLRIVASDNAGNSQTSAVVEDRRVDNTMPALTSSTPVDGSTVDTATSLVLVGTEALAGVANATIDGAMPPMPVVAGNTVTYTLPFADGPHLLAGELEDLAGNRTPIRVHFTVLSSAAGVTDFPYTEKNSFASASSTLAASSGLAEATVPVGGWTGAPTSDWLVIRIDPRPFVGPLSAGYTAGSDILDVTAYWAIAGTQVHDFVQPIDIRFSGAAANAVPALLEGSTWRAIAPVPGTSLPSGDQDGFYRSGTDVHVLTRHLSSFALLLDTQKPGKPRRFRGSNTNGRLVLRWAAATDNSGLIARYVVYANGAQIRTVGGSVLSADVGRFKATDGRKYQVRACDAAGNASALTYRLVIVPTVRNLTLADATTRLVQRGLKLGAVKRVYSTSIAAGRVVSASKSGVLRMGSGIPLSVSLGSANRPAPSGSSGGFFGPGTSSGSGTGTNGGSTGSPGTSPPPLPPAPPQPAPSANGGGEAEGDITTNFEATSQTDDSRLRQALGLALLGAAFILAGGALMRSRQRRYDEGAAVTSVEPVLFWDTRLLRFATRSIRRVTGH
jgi:large repetitive protein